MVIIHMAVGMVFGIVSVGYSFIMGYGAFRILIVYTVSGMVGMLMSATLAYARGETRRDQSRSEHGADQEMVWSTPTDRVPKVGRSTGDRSSDCRGKGRVVSQRRSSPIRLNGRDWSRPMVSNRRFGPEGVERRLLVLFDIDGTLLDGAPMIVRCVTSAFRAAGETPPSPEAVRNVIGLSTEHIIDRLARALPADRRAKVLSSYRVAFFGAIEREEDLPVFPGVGSALVRLRHAGITLGIASGRSRRGTGHLLDTLGWRPLFRTVQHGDANPSKPNPTMIYRSLDETGFAPEETVMVGDKCYDMRMARAAGIGAIGVSWGYDQPKLLLGAGAQSVVEDFEHLAEVLLALPAGRVEATSSS